MATIAQIIEACERHAEEATDLEKQEFLQHYAGEELGLTEDESIEFSTNMVAGNLDEVDARFLTPDHQQRFFFWYYANVIVKEHVDTIEEKIDEEFQFRDAIVPPTIVDLYEAQESFRKHYL